MYEYEYNVKNRSSTILTEHFVKYVLYILSEYRSEQTCSKFSRRATNELKGIQIRTYSIGLAGLNKSN